MTQTTPPRTAALQAALRLWTALAKDFICDQKTKKRLCAEQNTVPQHNDCPLCEHVLQTHGFLNCTQCPVDEWADESAAAASRTFGCIGLLYGEWEDLNGYSSGVKKRRALAAQIRDLIASNLPQE